jgi:hypothetical protein
MRIDLLHGGRRPLPIRLGIELFKLRAGVYPGPPLALTYRPDLLNKDLAGYIQRAMHGSGGWSRGEAELFAAFVSKLNSCNF